MNYAEIKYNDIANGPGCRTSLFVSGCRFHCKNCFNAIAWDFHYGRPFTTRTETQILESLSPKHTKGLTILGGEPMEPENRHVLAPFLAKVKNQYPNKGIWLFSGFTLEELLQQDDEDINTILSLIDVLVDGQYVEKLHDVSLRFRGSSNQRLIDMKKTLDTGKITIWNDGPIYGKRGEWM